MARSFFLKRSRWRHDHQPIAAHKNSIGTKRGILYCPHPWRSVVLDWMCILFYCNETKNELKIYISIYIYIHIYRFLDERTELLSRNRTNRCMFYYISTAFSFLRGEFTKGNFSHNFQQTGVVFLMFFFISSRQLFFQFSFLERVNKTCKLSGEGFKINNFFHLFLFKLRFTNVSYHKK